MKPVGSSVPLVHWFKIDVSNPSAPSLVAQGDVSGAAIGTGVATFNPSIAVDAAGDVLINFTASGPNMYPADYYVFQGGSDPTSSFSAPVLYQASTGFFNSGDGSSVQSWGLNSSATVDPNNPNSFWISNEYVANGWWQTAVARIAIQNSASGPTVSSIASLGNRHHQRRRRSQRWQGGHADRELQRGRDGQYQRRHAVARPSTMAARRATPAARAALRSPSATRWRQARTPPISSSPRSTSTARPSPVAAMPPT